MTINQSILIHKVQVQNLLFNFSLNIFVTSIARRKHFKMFVNLYQIGQLLFVEVSNTVDLFVLEIVFFVINLM